MVVTVRVGRPLPVPRESVPCKAEIEEQVDFQVPGTAPPWGDLGGVGDVPELNQPQTSPP